MTSRQRHRTRAPSASSTSTVSTATTTQTAASIASTSVPTSTTTGAGPSSNVHVHGGHSRMGPSIRRNLFHHHLSRRPASAASSSSAATSTAGGSHGATSHPDISSASASGTATCSATSSAPVDNGDIVARDKNGNYKIDVPVLPPVVAGEDGEEVGIEDIEEGPTAGSGAAGVNSSAAMETEFSGKDKEKIDASLVEMMCRNHRSRQVSSEPTEIFNLIQQSLRNRVASLDEDNWMYEVENDIRV
ncbi:hypothetical protein Egran_01640 [Elaphomyces granulatus]|uniref:Uncharacterized protein n=1 Tax=Elaphomyces granulatus TaxID=519963 RepID=A0A232M2K9_9EURO|nr:hypothetical protein Egran_01640 [Elaphomyces granulatus]